MDPGMLILGTQGVDLCGERKAYPQYLPVVHEAYHQFLGATLDVLLG
jgi:hypothetical protein